MKDLSRRQLISKTLVASAAATLGASTSVSALSAQSQPAQRTRETSPTFDVVIVGGGSAGAVMAARLSENPARRVLLLEAGHSYAPYDYPRLIADSDVLGANGNPEFEWGYRTEPGYVSHAIGAIRGKVLGGSSGVNGAVAIRARPEDFNRWDLPGWGYQDLLPAFKKLETRHGLHDRAIHGDSGPFPVVQLTLDDITPMQRAFVAATRANGYDAIDDFDGPSANGVGPYPMNIVNGVRVNTGMAYLDEKTRARDNLTLRADTLVDRVIFDGQHAIGVRLASGEEIHAAEVILSAGTYGSAAVLMRSGIAPAQQSKRLGIPVVADLPVGENLVDHPFYYNAYAARPDVIGSQSPVIGAKLWTHSSQAEPGELDLHITATHLFPHDQSPTGVGFVLAVALTRPQSTGRVWLESRDPAAAPHIDLNFLAQENDRVRLLEGVKLARKIGQTAPLSTLIHSELAPAADSDEAILASMVATLDTYHHPTSSAPMGNAGEPKAVVDLQGRVHGVYGLRVVDASIFPDVPSVATNVTTIATAEHIARHYA
ncbi:GMC family oxidoreductase N-terminal domain-containing protein [Serratia bockelmannii]|jgi:choline dehydrogenase|uniref:GMC family oxidoreductase n=1 Tax=Serratia TaxID=613 RepID=UPI0018D7B0E6|nr:MULTISPECIES: GMC oxidoreductase [Serratia]MBH2536173.1 GMC family oxidoreductase N-terminal domain-containing protein [Serratia marcescens]MBH2747329.1 GMC family oxidoreductase N-terminal domain-containing protein [Serratia marcescens]MBH2968283.1 GMC family oxidoreductase N-terminal domain-containing protein [Serratia marcescens]MBH3168784.1 GMC family oxidoreductase N-terminal domain-containing protein [Serratia marcescens]MBN6136359.1 GMC family oxidoreductase N-terminal domain-contain